mmetsp:Transcript_72242/g.200381  ORF Transcript_72242/g.200381 Transcript_72242/m.200381 type:complete len:208 (-) Transcript_72242:236-859(-)
MGTAAIGNVLVGASLAFGGCSGASVPFDVRRGSSPCCARQVDHPLCHACQVSASSPPFHCRHPSCHSRDRCQPSHADEAWLSCQAQWPTPPFCSLRPWSLCHSCHSSASCSSPSSSSSSTSSSSWSPSSSSQAIGASPPQAQLAAVSAASSPFDSPNLHLKLPMVSFVGQRKPMDCNVSRVMSLLPWKPFSVKKTREKRVPWKGITS